MTYKPDGYSDLSPYLIVPDPEIVLRFCEEVFDATRLRVFHDGDRIMHAECRIGDSVLMIGGAEGGAGAMLHLYLPDPDTAFAKAMALGAEELQPMMEKGDGDRRGGFRTPCGTQWYVSKQMGAPA
ncbi:bleomycin resistance protein [Mameliella alba]|nr:bleomycin resistance protein [Antarctobacter heliothermus]MBY6144319.1 bleomycin resistance protein [Mameliella alba]MBY6161390.1 bleomycin resistance protein [Mameliella alba]MBY6170144.1 bleomycin resistance protein [Mameliella alba]MBY6174879.1 bleomycin resistance protein [Mameliella alba]